MTSWSDVVAAAPELADAVRRSFAARKHATMATIRRGGSPRISGTEVDIDPDGEISVGMMPGTKRAEDLRRDPRVALHCPTVDPPVDDPAGWAGEGKIAGFAVEVNPDRFRIDIDTVVFTAIAPGGQDLEITTWRSARGVTVSRRR